MYSKILETREITPTLSKVVLIARQVKPYRGTTVSYVLILLMKEVVATSTDKVFFTPVKYVTSRWYYQHRGVQFILSDLWDERLHTEEYFFTLLKYVGVTNLSQLRGVQLILSHFWVRRLHTDEDLCIPWSTLETMVFHDTVYFSWCSKTCESDYFIIMNTSPLPP